MIDKSKEVAAFILCDPRAKMEKYIVPDDMPHIQEAINQGYVLMVEYKDETRDYIMPDEIDFSLLLHEETFYIVQQEVFVPLMKSMLELIEESMTPAVALLSVTGQKKAVNEKFEAFKEQMNNMLERYEPNLEKNKDGE